MYSYFTLEDYFCNLPGPAFATRIYGGALLKGNANSSSCVQSFLDWKQNIVSIPIATEGLARRAQIMKIKADITSLWSPPLFFSRL